LFVCFGIIIIITEEIVKATNSIYPSLRTNWT
jgi:hypothetical protein